MKRKQNLHTHSTFSDGKDSPEALILDAIDKGFESIGFSDHSYMWFSPSQTRLSAENMDEYFREIRRLKTEYKGKIDVFCGMEFEYYSEVPLDGFDYLIGSLHYLKLNGEVLGFDKKLDDVLEYVKVNFGGDGLAFSKKYFEVLSTLPERGKFDILGHFDLNVKNNQVGKFVDETSKEYLYAGYDAIHALKGKILLFEVNTGCVARGYRSIPYPTLDFLKEFKRCGFGAVVSSDCHNKEYLDCAFDEAEELLLAAGFKTKWVLTDKGFEEVNI